MIAIDTNILVYAHREDSPFHEKAYESILELAEGRSPWAIPWPCIHEFLAITTPALFCCWNQKVTGRSFAGLSKQGALPVGRSTMPGLPLCVNCRG
jgi:predicted nucleic acid-binding protein